VILLFSNNHFILKLYFRENDREVKLHKIGLGITGILILMVFPIVNALEQPRSLATCYADTAASLLFASMFTPTAINLYDPQMKTYITNYCNFYHEKLGIWVTDKDMPKLGEMTDQDIALSKEFHEKYKNTIPQSILELSNNINQRINLTNYVNQTIN